MFGFDDHQDLGSEQVVRASVRDNPSSVSREPKLEWDISGIVIKCD